jgi:predicted AlkP superfamily pyrophosphatase or phosphodiesterase
MTLRAILSLALVLLVTACASAPAPDARAPITILVSIDGFRADYLDRGQTPTLSRLAQTGVRASMRPSFPSVTFPNHYTLVTGKRPDRHGIINNTFEDPRFPMLFSMDAKVAFDPRWWEQATPIWVTAEKQGAQAATMFWPGSDFELEGVRPTCWRLFDQSLPGFSRVDALLGWLDDASISPRLFTLYFDLVDTAGHYYGPDAPETMGAVAEVDAAIARLVAGLEKRGRTANLVVVADHGMASISTTRTIDLGVAPDIARVIWAGPFAGIAPAAGREADAEAALLGRKEHGECWRKGEMPERLHYGTNSRIPAIICLADVGWMFTSLQLAPYSRVSLGAHGFDPASPEMAALFVANGPAFKTGVTLPAFDNVSVYPLLAQLVGIAPEANDGALSDTAAGLVGR